MAHDLETLREREARTELLTSKERVMLDRFYSKLEDAEALLLAPTLDRLRRERGAQEVAIHKLTLLREEKRTRLARIESLVRESVAQGQ